MTTSNNPTPIAATSPTTDTFTVVINDEEQYSIWPTFKAIPPGWREVGQRGSQDACLAYINEVWTDMRPKTLRDHMAARAPK
jgi:MbtH protein